MKKCPSFAEILKNDKSAVFLTAAVSFYIALIICLPLHTTLQTLTLTTVFLNFPISIAYHRLKNFSLKPQRGEPIPFSYFFLANLAIFSVYLYAAWPGCALFDMIYQWSEAQRAQFTDWHPAIHTMMIWCLTRICDKFQFVLIFQAVIFMWVNSSLCHEISKLGLSKKLSKWAFFLTIASPATCSLMMTIWKDISFAISVLGLTEILVLTYFSDGRWIKSNSHAVIFGVVLALASMLRHNGILFTLPFAAVFAHLFRRKETTKYIARAFAIAICLFAFVKLPLYSYLKVSPHPQAQAEMCGLPMTVLSEIFVKNPSVLDEETKDFLLSIEDYNTWKTRYVSGSWNSIKYLSAPNENDFSIPVNEKIMEFSPKKVCLKALKHGILDPENALNALVNLTGLTWRVTLFSDGLVKIYPLTDQNISKYVAVEECCSKENEENLDFDKGLFKNSPLMKRSTHDSIFKGILQIFIIAYSIMFCVFWRPGIYLLLLILSAFFSFHRLRWNAFLIISPILAYNFGTMLLLCGPNDFRFFFFNVLITFPYMFILFSSKQQQSKK